MNPDAFVFAALVLLVFAAFCLSLPEEKDENG